MTPRHKHPAAWLLLSVFGAAQACVQSAPIFSEVTPESDGLGGKESSGGHSTGGRPANGGSGASSGGDFGRAPSGGSEGPGNTSTGGEDNLGGASSLPGPSGTNLAIAAGDDHSCGVVDGALYCWGGNDFFALGLGDVAHRTMPARVGEDLTWHDVGCGNGFSCATSQETLYCWGSSSSGQTGTGTFAAVGTPTAVDLPGAVQQLSVGDDHVCVVLVDGTLWCWGNNAEGQLGQDDPFPGPGVNSAQPLPLGTSSEWDAVSAGQGHTCAIRRSGALYCWGRNTRGELGLPESAAGQIRSAQRVGSADDWAQVAAGQNHTLRRDGSFWCWGDNQSGQLGLGDAGPYYEPRRVPDPSELQQIATDTFHTCGVDSENRAFCLGRNTEGQLGDGSLLPALTGTTPDPALGWQGMATGRFHTCGVRDGAFYCSGENDNGRLGTGDQQRRQTFTPTQEQLAPQEEH